MIKRILPSAAMLVALLAAAAIPEGYYTALDGKMKADLKAAAKAAARDHAVVNYGEDTWEAFTLTDTRMVGENLCWWDMYSNNYVKVSNGHPGMNIEHSVANSWWGGTKNDAYKDLFHLNPSDATANSRKSNYPLGIVATQTWSNGVTTIGRPAAGECGGATNVFEPADCYKGDFARTFFYIFTIYDDISWAVTQTDRNYMFDGTAYPSLRPWAIDMLLEWAQNDPVDAKEIFRNEAIYSIQNNRNPFIDFPELAEYVWGSKSDVPFLLAEQTPNPEPDPIEPIDPNDPNDPKPGVEGVWKRVSLPQELASDKDYIIVSVKDYVAMGYTTVSTNKAMERAEDVLSVSEEGVISSIGSDVAIVRLVPSGADWMVEVFDQTGESRGYLKSTSSKNMTLSSTGSVVGITVDPEATLIDFGAEVGTLQYNPSSPRFCTYTSNQQGIALYVKDETNSVEENLITPVEIDGLWYDLTGRSVDPRTAAPGIYIRCGRKIIVRH